MKGKHSKCHLINSLRYPIYIINSVDQTKSSYFKPKQVWNHFITQAWDKVKDLNLKQRNEPKARLFEAGLKEPGISVKLDFKSNSFKRKFIMNNFV